MNEQKFRNELNRKMEKPLRPKKLGLICFKGEKRFVKRILSESAEEVKTEGMVFKLVNNVWTSMQSEDVTLIIDEAQVSAFTEEHKRKTQEAITKNKAKNPVNALEQDKLNKKKEQNKE